MYKIAICDNEMSVCSDLEENILSFFKDRSEECEVEVWNNSESLCREIADFDPEILFLEIEIREKNGVFVGKYIREILKNDRMSIVFISHNTSYAMELFHIHPYDFLVKPIGNKILCRTLIKILQLEESKREVFHYTYNKKGYSVLYSNIMYFSSSNKKVIIHRRDGGTESYYGKLKDIIDDLPFSFVCVGKSFIVNMKYIKSWKSNQVVLENDIQINIAQSRRLEFEKAIYEYASIG